MSPTTGVGQSRAPVSCAQRIALLSCPRRGRAFWSSKRSRALDPFIFGIVLVAIVSVGRTVRAVLVESIRRRPLLEGDSPEGSEELAGFREAMDGVIGRLERLEEERDFYKDLLDSPRTRREIPPPAAEEDTSDIGPA